MLPRAFSSLGAIFTDYGAIFSAPMSQRKRAALLYAYTKLTLIHFALAKVTRVTSISLMGYRIETINFYNLYFLFREIFVKGSYYAGELPKSGTILDCGANIGMATLYFNWMYPGRNIISFEPDPETFNILKKNVDRNNIKVAIIHNAALSDTEGEIELFVSSTNPGSLKTSTTPNRLLGSPISVPSVDLSSFLQDHVLLVKMDIEGAEAVVIPHLSTMNLLSRTQKWVIEYHHNIPGRQTIGISEFLNLFEKAGYSFQIDAHVRPWSPPNQSAQDVLIKATRSTE